MRTPVLGFTLSIALPVAAAAAPLTPTYYDMLNGNTGSYTYFDDTYNGSGDTQQTNAPLSGGLGDLTDGVIALQNWHTTPNVSNIPYVGWDRQVGTLFGHDPTNPIITFYFAPGTMIDSMTIYMDDSNGSGGVSPARGVKINGGSEIAISDQASGLPFSFVLNDLGITGDMMTVQLMHRSNFIMVSEVQFDGEVGAGAVPEPGTIGLVGVALAGLIARHRFRLAGPRSRPAA